MKGITEEAKRIVLDALNTFVLMLILTPVFLVIDGWILRELWTWYMMPLGIPGITLVHSIGLGIVFRMLTVRISDSRDKPEPGKLLKYYTEQCYKRLLVLTLFIFLGWVVHQFMN